MQILPQDHKIKCVSCIEIGTMAAINEDIIDEDINAEIFQPLRTAGTACYGGCNIFAVVGAAFKRLAAEIGR